MKIFAPGELESSYWMPSEKFLEARGCEKFEVTSNARRTRTHGFYLKNGYVEDSRRFVKYPGRPSFQFP